MELKKSHWAGIIAGFIVFLFALIVLSGTQAMFLVAGVGVIIAALPFVTMMIKETKMEAEREEMFLEFSRNLVESVKTGTPIVQSIMNISKKNYGALDKHIKKLGNQISLGIPLVQALTHFSKDVRNQTISRALTLIGQAERAGGDIGEILESVAGAVSMTDKLKKERKASVSTLVVQGYIIFLVFILIILVMQFQIMPMIQGIADVDIGIGGGGGGGTISQEELSSAFLYLMLAQGFFSGLAIGKLSEDSVKAGIKHSFALMLLSFFISTGANLLF